MSAYMHFMIKGKTEVLPILTVSRSNIIFKLFDDYAPYEWAAAIGYDTLNNIKSELLDIIKSEEEYKEKSIEKLDFIQNCNNSMEDKISASDDVFKSIESTEETLHELEEAKHFIKYLMDLICEIKYIGELDSNHYLYIGVECGLPSIEDINGWEMSKEKND